MRLELGRTTATIPRSNRSCRVSLRRRFDLSASAGLPASSATPISSRGLRAHYARCPARGRALWPYKHPSGNHMNLGVPFPRFCRCTAGRFLERQRPQGEHDRDRFRETALSLMRTICSTCNFSNTRSRTPSLYSGSCAYRSCANGHNARRHSMQLTALAGDLGSRSHAAPQRIPSIRAYSASAVPSVKTG
jgi:hypothetical protein